MAKVWRGLCGRCGSLGDHFADRCPTIQGFCGAPVVSEEASKEVRHFLHTHGLEDLTPAVSRLGVATLDDFRNIDTMQLVEEAGHDGVTVGTKEIQAISETSIDNFFERMASKVQAMMRKHYLFLSHYKLEAGTEASLMCIELEKLLDEDETRPAQGTEDLVFVDSEDLDKLNDLQTHVRNSCNLVLLLTKGVLTRPWVLVELATAVQAKVPVLPVKVSKRGSEFEYPDELFYQDFANGRLLEEEGYSVLKAARLDIGDITKALRGIFSRIAVPYSPHGRAVIRKAELQALLNLCHSGEAGRGRGGA